LGDTTLGESHQSKEEARAGGNRADAQREHDYDCGRRQGSRPESPETIRKLIKALQQKKFEPLTEQAFDNTLEEWSRLTLGSGYELETLKHVAGVVRTVTFWVVENGGRKDILGSP